MPPNSLQFIWIYLCLLFSLRVAKSFPFSWTWPDLCFLGWCFYINLPLGGFALFVIGMALKPQTAAQSTITLKEKLRHFDLLGTVFFLPCIICLLLAFEWGGSTYSWGNCRIILLFCLFGILFIIWITIQIKKGDYATLPLRIISQRSMAFGVWYMICLGSLFLLMIYYVSIWFQAIKGSTAVRAGIDTLPMVVSMSIFSIIAGISVGH